MLSSSSVIRLSDTRPTLVNAGVAPAKGRSEAQGIAIREVFELIRLE